MKQINSEVFYADHYPFRLKGTDIDYLKRVVATNSSRNRVRLCTHSGTNNNLHEMFILMMKGAYNRPHKNLKENKSFYIIEGETDLVEFDEEGKILDVTPMSDYQSGLPFYSRVSHPGYHTLIFKSDVVVFKETVNGPFEQSDTVYAEWAPPEDNVSEVNKYMKSLIETITSFTSRVS